MDGLRERPIENDSPPTPGNGAGSDATNLSGLRQSGEDLIAAGDEAIRRALSSDSEGFLSAVRQEGGQ